MGKLQCLTDEQYCFQYMGLWSVSVLSLNLSHLGQRTQFLLEPASNYLEKPTADHHGEIFLKICHHSQQTHLLHIFSGVCFEYSIQAWWSNRRRQAQSSIVKPLQTSLSHLVICFLSFQYILQYSNHTHVYFNENRWEKCQLCFLWREYCTFLLTHFNMTRLVRESGFTRSNLSKWVTLKLWILTNTP